MRVEWQQTGLGTPAWLTETPQAELSQPQRYRATRRLGRKPARSLARGHREAKPTLRERHRARSAQHQKKHDPRVRRQHEQERDSSLGSSRSHRPVHACRCVGDSPVPFASSQVRLLALDSRRLAKDKGALGIWCTAVTDSGRVWHHTSYDLFASDGSRAGCRCGAYRLEAPQTEYGLE